MGKMSREKGKRSELDLVHYLRDFYGIDVRRGDCFRGEADVIGMPGIWIEVKNHQKVDIGSWYWQAWETTKKHKGGVPVVFHKENRKPWLVTLAYNDWTMLGGDECDIDNRIRFNLRSVFEKHGIVRYFRQGVDLITVSAEDFMDEYVDWMAR